MKSENAISSPQLSIANLFKGKPKTLAFILSKNKNLMKITKKINAFEVLRGFPKLYLNSDGIELQHPVWDGRSLPGGLVVLVRARLLQIHLELIWVHRLQIRLFRELLNYCPFSGQNVFKFFFKH